MIYIRNNNLYLLLAGLTMACGAAGLLAPVLLDQLQYSILIVLVLFIGLPHGATDFILFKHLKGLHLNKKQVFWFFFFYLSACFGYLIGWLIMPGLAIILFLLISAYHFGQSNWQWISFPRWLSVALYVSWGAFVLGGALLWHWGESKIVIGQLLGYPVNWPDHLMAFLQWVLLLLNAGILFGLWATGWIRLHLLLGELTTLVVLSFMFYFSPMLVGFAIYFTLWHSLGSLLNQLDFFRRKWPSFTLVNYYRQAAPYTILAVMGLIGLIVAQTFIFTDVSLVSLFFILISCLTLPHIYLIEQSLNQ